MDHVSSDIGSSGKRGKRLRTRSRGELHSVQPYWTGAYHGFAIGSLKKDTEEIEAAVQHLRAQGQ